MDRRSFIKNSTLAAEEFKRRGFDAVICIVWPRLCLPAGEFETAGVYFTTPLTSDENVSQFSNVITTAKAGGMNGVMLGLRT